MSKNTLWDNAMVRNAKANMSKEDIKQYKKIGEQFYKDMDFQRKNNIDSIIQESASYLSSLLNSGLLPHNLNKDEKRVLREIYSDKWYEKWGYTEKDLKKSE